MNLSRLQGKKDDVQKSIVLKYFSNKIFKNYSHFLKICPHTYLQGFVDINWRHHAILLVCIILLTVFYLTLWALLNFSLLTGLHAGRRKIKLGTRRITSTLRGNYHKREYYKFMQGLINLLIKWLIQFV